MSELRAGELALFQVLFQPVRGSWTESILKSVTDQVGKPFFANRPELLGAAERKVAKPLFAAVVRIMVCSVDSERIVQLGRDIGGSLHVFAHPSGNELIPLRNSKYPAQDHINDVLARQSRRSGMLLNSDELMGFVHLPSSAVRSPTFQRQTSKTRTVPFIGRHEDGLLLGINEHAGEVTEVRLTPDQRVRHTHVIGASGTGKSTLLFNLIKQSIENGEGIAVLDPHGDLIERILEIIPQGRIDDVIYINPADPEYSIGFNILSAHSELEKNLLASDLVATFRRLSTSWGDQMNSVLQNAILAFLECDRRGTISDLRRFLIEPSFRNQFLKSVKDSEVVYFWQKSLLHLPSIQKSIGSILTRLDIFLAQKTIRYMVSQPENRLDFAHIMDTRKILLAKLSEGILGKENSQLLGTLLVSKFQQIAMSRQAQQAESRRLFNIFIDEFANFITPSMAETLSGARKYRIGLTLAHHELHQLQQSPEVASAVMTHPYTRIVFRVGDEDAKKLTEGFSYFDAKDLRNLETGQAICRVERSDFDFNLYVTSPSQLDATEAARRREEVITASRKKYGTPRAEVEAMLAKSLGSVSSSEPAAGKTPPIVPKPEPARAAENVPPPLPVSTPESKSEIPPPLSEILKSAPLKPVAPAIIEQSEPITQEQGRGGAEHQAVQKRIRDEAEKLGFHRIIEKPVLDGAASIDVWLERDGLSIACEVSFTNTESNEAEKIARCLKGGIPQMAMICSDKRKLRKIEGLVSKTVSPELSARVGYFQPEAFIEYLKELPVEPSAKPVRMSRGYKVRRSQAKVSTEEAAIQAIAESMKDTRKR